LIPTSEDRQRAKWYTPVGRHIVPRQDAAAGIVSSDFFHLAKFEFREPPLIILQLLKPGFAEYFGALGFPYDAGLRKPDCNSMPFGGHFGDCGQYRGVCRTIHKSQGSE
jgi:hypothetical protein